MMIVDKFPKIKDNNYVVDVHTIYELLFYCVVPHQMVHRRKNFWGAEVTTMEYNGLTPSTHVGNKPIKEKIFEYITDTPQTVQQINRQLRADGYNLSFDTDIKAFIYKLKAEDRIVTHYNNKIMTVTLSS